MVTQSKSESYLYQLLCDRFPELKILPNDRLIIAPLEIDIAIPELSIAIEWNGIFHRKPIGGKRRLIKRQQRDKRKQLLLKEMKWDLYIVETDKSFNSTYIINIFNILTKYIKDKLCQKAT